MRREDSGVIEARLRERDLDAFGEQQAAQPVLESATEKPFQDEGQQADASAHNGGQDDIFAALGNALDEIEAETKAATYEIMVPTEDRLEIQPALDTYYKRVTRSFICLTDPPLTNTTRERKQHGQIVDSIDKRLEDLLNDSLLRARHTFEQRRAQDVRWSFGRNR